MPVQTVLIDKQLHTLQENFIQDTVFLEYVNAEVLIVFKEKREQLKMLEKDLKKRSFQAVEKHFTQCKSIKTLPLALAGEVRTAILIAR